MSKEHYILALESVCSYPAGLHCKDAWQKKPDIIMMEHTAVKYVH